MLVVSNRSKGGLTISAPEFGFTHHAMLVVWGQFAHRIGLIEQFGDVPLRQKTLRHAPQTKVLEFLVAMLTGVEHLQDISRSAHPLDADYTVAHAWGQPAWADYSGVSRTLAQLRPTEVEQIVRALQTISQPFVDQEVVLALRHQGRLVYDADLTGRPVSNTSSSYPNVAYGHMSDGIHLGYQAALVSLHSPTYGRLWLSVTPHPGDTIAATQAEAVVYAAETRTGARPRRRTELLQQRLESWIEAGEHYRSRLQRAQQAVAEAEAAWTQVSEQLYACKEQLAAYEVEYQRRQLQVRPYSRLAKARRKVASYQQRLGRREETLVKAQKRVARATDQFVAWDTQRTLLQERLHRFEQDNSTNPSPIQAVFRLDAGFGTAENVALLIEMGYEVYTKSFGIWLQAGMKRQVTAETVWTQVGKNATMTAWSALRVADCPYPLDVALERFVTGDNVRHSVLLHYGNDPVTEDLPAWFHMYNARQIVEAGIKEGKNVFTMHHLKVRSQAGLMLQEQFAAFAANFVRWAAQWLSVQCHTEPDGWYETPVRSIKQQVRTLGNTSAYVTWHEQGCLVRFAEYSIFAGHSLDVTAPWIYQLVLPLFKSVVFSPE